MAGTVTMTITAVPRSGGVSKVALAWTADGSGNVSGNSLALGPGSLVVVEFVNGSPTPTSLYDVDFLDAGGESMFDDGTGTSIGANLSNSVNSHRVPMMVGTNATPTYFRSWLQGGSYQLTVANAGAGGAGTVNIFQVPGVL